MYPRRNTPRHIIITLPKIKDKEKILKAEREKETVTYRGVPIKLSADFSKESLQPRRQKIFLRISVQSHEKQGPPSEITPPRKTVI